MFSPLRDPAYRHLFAAQVSALLGTGLATVALGLLAHDLAGAQAGEILGAALAIKMICYVAVAPVAGAIATNLPQAGSFVINKLGSDRKTLAATLRVPPPRVADLAARPAAMTGRITARGIVMRSVQ